MMYVHYDGKYSEIMTKYLIVENVMGFTFGIYIL